MPDIDIDIDIDAPVATEPSAPAAFRFPDHEMEKAEPRLSAFR